MYVVVISTKFPFSSDKTQYNVCFVGLMSQRVVALPNRPHKFKDRDIVRVVKAAKAAGVNVKAVVVDPHSGLITVQGGDGTEPDRDTPEGVLKNL